MCFEIFASIFLFFLRREMFDAFASINLTFLRRDV